MRPETKYVKSGDYHIAYQVVGEGPLDLMFVHGWISHIEHMWEEPGFARFLRRLASFSRLVLVDKRGTGLSDPVPLNQLPTLEERMDDIRAVMDTVGCGRAALLGPVNTTEQFVVYWGYENHRVPISSDRGLLSASARQCEPLQSRSA